MNVPTWMRGPLPIALLAACLCACSQSPAADGATTTDSPDAATPTLAQEPGAQIRRGTTAAGAGTQAAIPPGALQRIEQLLARWDAHQAEGELAQAKALEPTLRGEVDSVYGDLVVGARGDSGKAMQFLGVTALAFASDSEATRILAARLTDGDDRLVGNALVALNIRQDPNTPMAPVVRLIDPRAPQLSQRYAPLVFATIVDTRRMSLGQNLRADEREEALQRLIKVANSRDGYTRLHVAKALGAIGSPTAAEALRRMVERDEQMRVRWASAAALSRIGDPRGFPEVVRLLHDVPPESKAVIRDLLVSYAGRMQGTPLTPRDVQDNGISSGQWSRWHGRWVQARQQGRRTAVPTATSSSFPRGTPPSGPAPMTQPPGVSNPGTLPAPIPRVVRPPTGAAGGSG